MIMIDVRIALKSLRAARVRTALTVLGIVIGVATMTAVLAISEGAKINIRSQVAKLGNNVLTIRSGEGTRDKAGNLTSYNFWAALGSTTISEFDLQTVQATPGVKAASPIMAITGSIRTNPTSAPAKNSTIIATNTGFNEVAGLKVQAGSFLDDIADRNTVVLGNDLASQVLGSNNAIGQTIYLRGQPFTVIGILGEYAMPANLNDLYDYNHTAFIDLDAGKAFNQGIAQIQQINLRVTSARNIQATGNRITSELLKNHGGEPDFVVLRPEEALTLTDNVLGTITRFSSAIAAVSLFVGGIGIMNIMLVSVTERTREIGIRKAVGATSAQILRQFLIESLVMSLVGGLFGVGLAYVVAFGVGTFINIMPVINWQIFGTAMTLATVVGIIFGVTPAFKAAGKNPIDALRFFQ